MTLGHDHRGPLLSDYLLISIVFQSLSPQTSRFFERRFFGGQPVERMIRTLRVRLRPMNCRANVPAVEPAAFGPLARWRLIPKLTQDI